jgi:hypothetical protein
MNERLYKLTTPEWLTRPEEPEQRTLWGPGVEHTAPGPGPLASNKVLHAYRDPRIAVLLNPCHARIKNPVLWKAEGDICIEGRGSLKVGCTRLKTLQTMPLPEIYLDHWKRIGVLLALPLFPPNSSHPFVAWADRWLTLNVGGDAMPAPRLRTFSYPDAANAGNWSRFFAEGGTGNSGSVLEALEAAARAGSTYEDLLAVLDAVIPLTT